ncbi:DUF1642 domain-containing protein [Enterococcus faecium]|uniref:DUF1642 domain-containing protein n=1 Tax=Enterococcus faecium TaxID=1352 RepID=A0A2C9X3A5_ENTFC|nr:DUF1642 domain-containing protein [Enterococcus faecium]OTN87538.1 hypothetical protein A5810_002856 [Enterococcus faecium]
MNKQELIDKWGSKTGAPSYEISDFSINPSKNDMYIAGYGVARAEIIEDLKQLDEPQNPVVPQFVAEWIEKLRKQIVPYHFESGARFMMFIGRDFHHKKGLTLINEEIRQWLEKDGNEVILSNVIDYGYEVEKEPLYRVVINNRYLAKMSNFSDVVILVSEDEISECATESYELTEKQIKAIDERYWPFAVPVEEVAEG